MKDEARRYNSGAGMGTGAPWPPVVKWLLIANIACFVMQMFYPPFQEWLIYDGAKVLRGEVWRLLTAAFLHSQANYFHIVLNMLLLVTMGRQLERDYGSREFLAFYLCAAVASSLFALGIDLLVGKYTTGLGASGAVMGVFFLFAKHYPRAKFLLLFVFPVEARWLLLAFIAYNLFPVVMEVTSGKTFGNIGYAAHLGGLLFGWLYWKTGWSLGSLIPGRLVRNAIPPGAPAAPLGGAQPRATVRRKPKAKPKAVQLKVDEILDKVSEHGLHSLTEKERRFLEKASDDMKG